MEIASIIVSAIALLLVIYRDVIREHIYRPQIRVDFSLDEPISRGVNVGFPVIPLDSPRESYIRFWTRLRVTNKGRSTAKHCEAVLAEVRSSDGSLDTRYDPLVLRWAISPEPEGLRPLDLAPGRQVDLNLLMTEQDGRTVSIVTHTDPIGAAVTFQPGEYWFKVSIYGDNFAPVEHGYALRWDGSHYKRGIDIRTANTPPSSKCG
ncbi:hypothetical protein ACFLUT_03395 [Chloroflexota bacterium]